MVDGLGDGEVGEEAAVLEHDADPWADLAPFPVRVVPEDSHRARVDGPVPLQGFEGGRLAGAVRAEQREQLARPDVEGDAGDGLELP
ncbi:hypothetical protein GCM10009736_07310 [Actinomadura bangladeshensis]